MENKQGYAVVLGTCIMDVAGCVEGELVPADKNPGAKVTVSTGGAARNIGDNLARLGYPVRLISAVGDDGFGTVMREDCAKSGMDVSGVETIKGRSSAVYLAILNGSGDMVTALTDLDLRLVQNVDFYKKYDDVFRNASAIIVTSETMAEVIAYLHETYPQVPIMGDIATIGLLDNMTPHFGYYHTIKANELEAQTLSGIEISDEDSLRAAAEKILSMGIHRIIITLGGDGAFYLDDAGASYRVRQKKVEKMANATGAGDAFTAGFLYKDLTGAGVEEALEFGMSTAIIALSSPDTISKEMGVEKAEEVMKAYRLD